MHASAETPKSNPLSLPPFALTALSEAARLLLTDCCLKHHAGALVLDSSSEEASLLARSHSEESPSSRGAGSSSEDPSPSATSAAVATSSHLWSFLGWSFLQIKHTWAQVQAAPFLHGAPLFQL